MTAPELLHRHVEVTGARLFCRETVPAHPDGATVLLLHGFPSASHQFRRLMDAVGDRHRLIAVDYPGFGYSQVTDPNFPYTFERLADSVEEFCVQEGVTQFVAYMFDFGGPVGMRLAERHPDWFAGLVIQNANSYEAGLSAAAREFITLQRAQPGSERRVRALMTPSGTRQQYEGGARQSRIAPDGWTLDQHFLDLPGRLDAQVDLAFDYITNLQRYPVWQQWLREQQPPTLVVWGANDPFFVPEGAWAYRRDLPAAEVVVFDTGHFVLEDYLPQVASHVLSFLERVSSADPRPST